MGTLGEEILVDKLKTSIIEVASLIIDPELKKEFVEFVANEFDVKIHIFQKEVVWKIQEENY